MSSPNGESMKLVGILDTIGSTEPRDTDGKWLADYKDQFTLFKQDFFSTPINSHEQPGLACSIKVALERLGVPDYQRGRFDGAPLTVYAFLQELQTLNLQNTEGQADLDALIKEIDALARSRRRAFFIGGVIATAALGGAAMPLGLAGHLSTVNELLATALFLPVVGLMFTAGVALYSLYQNTSDHTVSWRKKLKNNFFLLANTALNVTGYAMLLTAATTTAPVVGTLFVVAAAVQVVAKIVQVVTQDKRIEGLGDNAGLPGRQLQTRHNHEHRKQRNALLIDVGIALFYAGLITLWCLVPGGFLMSAGVVAAIGVLYLVKNAAQRWNEKRIDAQLQQSFTKLEESQAAAALQKSPDSQLEITLETIASPTLVAVPSGGKSSSCGRSVCRVLSFGLFRKAPTPTPDAPPNEMDTLNPMKL